MIKLDYFQEFGDGSDAPSLGESLGVLDPQDRMRIASYLDGGAVVSAVPGYDKDLLDGSILGLTGSRHTDGTYVWRHHLKHYVVKYGVGLREDFVTMVRNGDKPTADLTADEIRAAIAFIKSFPRPE
ncbi:MAG TPA: hypothetical protein VIJ31_03175 [Acidothermaceae bacterium]